MPEIRWLIKADMNNSNLPPVIASASVVASKIIDELMRNGVSFENGEIFISANEKHRLALIIEAIAYRTRGLEDLCDMDLGRFGEAANA